VRSETEIAKGAVSISSAAVELAVLKAVEDLGKPLDEVSVTILGAGKMTKLLLTHLASHGVTKVVLLNRSRGSAEALAALYPDVEIRVGLMDELWSTMAETDLVFTSTSSTECILTKEELEPRGWGDAAKQLMAIDISVPRNVASECNELDGVFAYNVDDLKAVVAKNQARRKHKVLEAEVLLRAELAKFVSWQESLKFVPAISKLQAKYEEVRVTELTKASKKGLKQLDEKQRVAVDVLTKQIINKLLHAPMSYLRSDDADGMKASLMQVNDMFQLEDKKKKGK
jgi:glutamyl-tRNA reductase